MNTAADMNFVTGPAWQQQSDWNVDQKNAPAIRQRARYNFIDLIRPDCYDTYTVEQRFGVLRWMVERAVAISPTRAETGRWGVSGPLELLSKKPSCVNHSHIDPIDSLPDLKERFNYALLAKHAGPSAYRWRKENGIAVTERKVIHFPHYVPFDGAPLAGKIASEAGIREAVSALLAAEGTLTTQLNGCYAQAVEIYGVQISVLPQGFRFVLRYGFDGSVWYETLAATPNMWDGDGETFRYLPYGRKSEPFISTLDRAITRMKELTVPSAVCAPEEMPHVGDRA